MTTRADPSRWRVRARRSACVRTKRLRADLTSWAVVRPWRCGMRSALRLTMSWTRGPCVVMGFSLAAAACGSRETRFPLRDPMWRDTDFASVRVPCRKAPTAADRSHRACTPEPYDGTLYWDAADNILFRPLSEALGVVTSHEAVNVNALDEVPDSTWFTNRIGVRDVGSSELELNACPRDKLLDPEHTPAGGWIIDKGKGSGSTPGFRINVPGKGKYLVKVEGVGLPERQVAASVIGAAVYWAAGYNASCEQALYVRPSIFRLNPGLVARRGNFGDVYSFDQAALDDMLAKSTHQGELVRISVSAWVPGFGLGQFRYEGVRSDDPNDIIPHEDRRELRGARLLVAWLDHFDSREGNSFDTWMADDKKEPDSSPGHVVHYQLGTSAALGSMWNWVADSPWTDQASRRLGYSYLVDWADVVRDFFTLGIPLRPWDTVHQRPGHELFGYMNVADFDPEAWKNEYPNKAFSRMSDRDAAWMARILARFTPELITTLARMGRFSDTSNTRYLASVLEGRLERILERYLLRLSPIAALQVEGDALCGIDLAEWRHLRDPSRFHYAARTAGGAALETRHVAGGSLCVTLRHVPRGADNYVRVLIEDGVAAHPLVAHVYDVGTSFKLVGIER